MKGIEREGLREKISAQIIMIYETDKLHNIDDIVFDLVSKCFEKEIEADIDTLIASCIYAAGRTQIYDSDFLRSTVEIANSTGIDRKQIARTYRLIHRELNLKIRRSPQETESVEGMIEFFRRMRLNLVTTKAEISEEGLALLETFVKDHIDVIRNALSKEIDIWYSTYIIGSGDRLRLNDVVEEMAYGSRAGKSGEYWIKYRFDRSAPWPNPGEDNTGPDFSEEEYRALLREDYFYQEHLESAQVGYDYLKSQITSSEKKHYCSGELCGARVDDEFPCEECGDRYFCYHCMKKEVILMCEDCRSDYIEHMESYEESPEKSGIGYRQGGRDLYKNDDS